MINLPGITSLLDSLKTSAATAGGWTATQITDYFKTAAGVADNLFKAGETGPSKIVALYSSSVNFVGGGVNDVAYSGNIAKDMAARGSGIVALDVTKFGFALLELQSAIKAGASDPLIHALAGGDTTKATSLHAMLKSINFTSIFERGSQALVKFNGAADGTGRLLTIAAQGASPDSKCRKYGDSV
jgi:hypothetical protein